MTTNDLQFLATPSITVRGAWVGLVVSRRTGAVCMQTIVTYRSAHEARFGARRSWVACQRMLERNLALRA